MRQPREQRRTALGAGLQQEFVRIADQFGQREVVAGGRACGPVFIDVQKQVPPAWPQFTATMKTPSRRAW